MAEYPDLTPSVDLRYGDCLAVLRQLPDESVSVVICDPPYGLAEHKPERIAAALVAWTSGDREHVPDGRGFMGRAWDAFVPPPAVWDECLRVLKPGGHLAAFAGSRTYDLMGMSIRLAGFEIRDGLQWLYGSGMPKGQNVAKAIEAGSGRPEDIRRMSMGEGYTPSGRGRVNYDHGAGSAMNGATGAWGPTTPAAARWEGWNTSLKPSVEPLVLAVKPLDDAGMLDAIGSHLDRLESECESLVSGAEPSSSPTPPTSPVEADGSALDPAAIPPGDDPARPRATGRAEGSRARTATSWSASVAGTCSNTVTSWRACWGELCELTNTSTTSTTSGPTTALRTLLSCLSRLTAESMATSISQRSGLSSPAAAADNLFAAAVLNSRATLALSVDGTATADTPTSPQGATARGSSSQEPIVLARKPIRGTVAANVLAHGTGAMNVDASRVRTAGAADEAGYRAKCSSVVGLDSNRTGDSYGEWTGARTDSASAGGRWPANVLLTHAPECHEPGECAPGCPVAELDAQSGIRAAGAAPARRAGMGYHGGAQGTSGERVEFGEGGASRFFPSFRYQAKAPASERPKIDGKGWPTVKPQGLMRWLVRLLTPAGGTVLDPFAGTGSTLQAARDEGFPSIGIERDEFAYQLSCRRLDLPEVVPATVTDAETGEPVALAVVAEEGVQQLVEDGFYVEHDPVDPVLSAIESAASYGELVTLYREHREAWTDEHSAAAKTRRAQIEEVA